LLSRLNKSFGVSGLALSWLQSYLQNRSQYVHVAEQSSNLTHLSSGVPQGSVLGPILFSAYISPIGRLVSLYNLSHQQYADDTQLYISLAATDFAQSITILETCLTHIHYWLSFNGLCLNLDKSEAILFGTSQRLKTFPAISSISVAGCSIPLADKIKTLGVILDRNLNFNHYISAIYKSCFYYIKAIRHINTSLTRDVCNTIATSLVQSRLDYANSILYGISASNLNKLQRVQNKLAKTVLVSRSPNQSSTDLLHTLHWLPVKDRINFKIATLTYNLLNTRQPSYLSCFLEAYRPIRDLRSSALSNLQQPASITNFGTRAFSVAAPRVWNTLPLDIKQCATIATFRRHLKTFYFSHPQ